ncbi:MAG TPA: hypothetical protein VK308_08000 [Pyrinomonadaceae bacterium]|nr:hypothetical protein [Pyrinomonadaceae bacterium]
MSETTKKPWGFGLVGGNKGGKTFAVFFIILIITLVVQIAGYFVVSYQTKEERPVLALNSFLRDVREFVKTEKRMPANLKEIENKVWLKAKPNQPTRLHYGNRVMVSSNYEYIYFAGTVDGVGIANVWAIPLGKFRDEAETVLLVIAPEGESVWRGPALTAEQREFVFAKGFNPTFPQMSALNMSKDAPKAPQTKSSGRRFGLW